VGGWDFDPRTGKGRWTSGTLAIHGLTEPPSSADSGVERFEGDARVRIEAALDEAATRGTPYDLELPFTDVNGRHKWVRAVCRPVLDGTRVVRLRGTLQDITAQKRSELALQRFMQASPIIIYALAIEPSGPRLVRLEGDLERLTGWRPSQVDAGDWWRRNIHPEDLERVLAHNPAPDGVDHLAIDFRFRRADGRYLWLHDDRRLIRNRAGHVSEVVGSWSDITERVDLEMQLRQSQKLEAIGQLAGGIAHDFNNLMTVVIGTSDILGGLLPRDPAIASLVEDIRMAGERAATLTRQLLAFSRKQVLHPVPTDVNEAVRGLDSILRRLISEDITVRCEFGERVGHVMADPGQLEQMLINLAVNARDAMPQGGTLTIRTSLVEGPAIEGALAVPHACITMTDTGHGMSPELLTRIFEPFFTTKPVGRGTGLGLAVVFGIVKQSGGHITVESTPGAGSTFHLYLPRTDTPRVAQTAPTALARGTETVMVVDDEEGVRRVAAVVLARSGYRVIEASSAEDALAKAGPDVPLDLLLTDVVMPGMGGPALAGAMRAARPGLKVLFMSGYVDDALERHGLEHMQRSLLSKPFTPQDLAARVRHTLDERG
jgi:two-component system cell cycle sensor histidine kinase/response regulator CckA